MRPLVLTSSPALLVGIRRVVSDSRGAWRNISAIALMGVVATLASTLSFVTLSQDVDSTGASIQEMIAHDIRQGVMIAFAFALIIGAVSTLIHQSSDVFDRAGEARTLVRNGNAGYYVDSGSFYSGVVTFGCSFGDFGCAFVASCVGESGVE